MGPMTRSNLYDNSPEKVGKKHCCTLHNNFFYLKLDLDFFLIKGVFFIGIFYFQGILNLLFKIW